MAGIYIHIPFCSKRCNYCDFHFSTSLKLKSEIIESIQKEITLKKDFFGAQNSEIQTIYFGGGTPSILFPEELEAIINTLKLNFEINKNIEITLEANPENIDEFNLESWYKLGINRLSLGIQSFNNDILSLMNRSHNGFKAIESLKLIEQSPIDNYNFDLIFGSSLHNMDILKHDIETLLAYSPNHISTYGLTIEEGTAFHNWVTEKKMPDIDQEKASEQYTFIMETLRQHGYDHYEISNFALPKHESKHNTSYWNNKKFLGLGPSAHSYDGKHRYENIRNNSQYIQAINKNTQHYTIETLTTEQQYNEYIMTQLRKKGGINIKEVTSLFPKFWNLKKANKFKEEGLLQIEDNQIYLTDEGKLFADSICLELFN